MEKNEIKKEENIEEMDSDFLKELNQLSKQLKTDDEIINDYKSKNFIKNEDKEVKNDNIPINKNDSESNINNNLDNEINNLNKLLNNNNINENPFQEAYNSMNSKGNFNFDENELIMEPLNSLYSQIYQFNSILNKTINTENINIQKDSNGNIINENEILEKENNVIGEILDFLIQSNLIKDTILNMRKSIENSLEKNKNNLKKEEKEKYQEALQSADKIINETNKVNPDKNKIMDCLQQLQQISNDIDSILFVK